MLSRLGKWAAVAAAVAAGAAVSGALFSPSAAQAATYNSACGNRYAVVALHDLGPGNVYLAHNSSNGNSCVVTVRDQPGTPMWMVARINQAGGVNAAVEDHGFYTASTGPVLLHTDGICYGWSGTIGTATVQVPVCP